MTNSDSKRGFKLIEGAEGVLPVRGTKNAAAYDFYASHSFVIKAGKTGLVKTGVSVYMQSDEWLQLKGRSGLSLKRELIVGAGVIDADYTGEIGFVIHNFSKSDYKVQKGERIGQGIFSKFLIADDDQFLGERKAGEGYGSTGR